jgi:succinylornithine transaminase family protein
MTDSQNKFTRATFDEVMVPNYAPVEMIPVRGEGARVWDQADKEYIDFAGGIAVNSLGHAHPALTQVIKDQSEKLWHVSNVYTNEPALELASKLTQATFADKVFFANSGAEANEAAFKLARKYAFDHFDASKNEIIATNASFHGRTLFTVSVGGQPSYKQGFEPTPQGISHVEFNNIDALKAAISEKTCAVVLEPVQGEGGVHPASKEYLQAARELCNQHNALLIFDEVQTGMGRTGNLFAYQGYDVTPDVLTSAKSLGGGFPIGAMLTTAKIADSLGFGTHGSTYGGNPLACAVAGKVFDIVNTKEVLQGVKNRNQMFLDGLKDIDDNYAVFKEVRSSGLLIGAELIEKYHGHAKDFIAKASEHGLMMLVAGPNVLRFTPSLIISDEEITEGLARLKHAVAEVVKG